MGGSLPFDVALERRLSIIQPSAAMCSAFMAAHPLQLTPGVRALVEALHRRGTAVYLVSGGFTQVSVRLRVQQAAAKGKSALVARGAHRG
jgi:phosphoserine phosphatase